MKATARVVQVGVLFRGERSETDVPGLKLLVGVEPSHGEALDHHKVVAFEELNEAARLRVGLLGIRGRERAEPGHIVVTDPVQKFHLDPLRRLSRKVDVGEQVDSTPIPVASGHHPCGFGRDPLDARSPRSFQRELGRAVDKLAAIGPRAGLLINKDSAHALRCETQLVGKRRKAAALFLEPVCDDCDEVRHDSPPALDLIEALHCQGNVGWSRAPFTSWTTDQLTGGRDLACGGPHNASKGADSAHGPLDHLAAGAHLVRIGRDYSKVRRACSFGASDKPIGERELSRRVRDPRLRLPDLLFGIRDQLLRSDHRYRGELDFVLGLADHVSVGDGDPEEVRHHLLGTADQGVGRRDLGYGPGREVCGGRDEFGEQRDELVGRRDRVSGRHDEVHSGRNEFPEGERHSPIERRLASIEDDHASIGSASGDIWARHEHFVASPARRLVSLARGIASPEEIVASLVDLIDSHERVEWSPTRIVASHERFPSSLEEEQASPARIVASHERFTSSPALEQASPEDFVTSLGDFVTSPEDLQSWPDQITSSPRQTITPDAGKVPRDYALTR